jgi:phage RecT family recombinase
MGEYPLAKTKFAEKVLDGSRVIKGALSSGLDPDQFISSLILEANALKASMDPQAMEDPRTMLSFVRASFNAAVVGLMPGAVRGHCYFVPYTMFRGKRGEHVVINFIPGYRGFLELAYANNFLVQCDPEVVLAGEDIRHWHDEKPRIQHEIPIDRDRATRENVIGAYCTYRTRAGGTGLVYMDRSELADIDTGRNVWKSNYVAMCLKSPIRRAAKRWRTTRQMDYAIDLDERAERGVLQPSLVPEKDVEEEKIDLNTLKTDGGGE